MDTEKNTLYGLLGRLIDLVKKSVRIKNDPDKSIKRGQNIRVKNVEKGGDKVEWETYTPSIPQTLLVSLNSPKGNPSDPYDYELMVSTNGIDWTGVPNTNGFAGKKIPLGTEGYINYYTHPISKEKWYIFSSGASNSGREGDDIQFACTKDMENFYTFSANLGAKDVIPYDEYGPCVWVPSLLIDKDGNPWVSISIRSATDVEHYYPWQTPQQFQQYITRVQFKYDQYNNITGCQIEPESKWEKITFQNPDTTTKTYDNIIDCTILYEQDVYFKNDINYEYGDKYVMTFKDNDKCVVNIAVSDTPKGPYTVIKEDLFDLPFTESGFTRKINGNYLYTCVNHSNITGNLCCYAGWGGSLGSIANFSEVWYNGPMKNIGSQDSTYLRMRMVFPIVADEFLTDWILKRKPVIKNRVNDSRGGEWQTKNCLVGTWDGVLKDPNGKTLEEEHSFPGLLDWYVEKGVKKRGFTVVPNTCYDFKDETEVIFNATHTSGCNYLNLKGNVPCTVTVNLITVKEDRYNWKRQWYWDGHQWVPENYDYGINTWEMACRIPAGNKPIISGLYGSLTNNIFTLWSHQYDSNDSNFKSSGILFNYPIDLDPDYENPPPDRFQILTPIDICSTKVPDIYNTSRESERAFELMSRGNFLVIHRDSGDILGMFICHKGSGYSTTNQKPWANIQFIAYKNIQQNTYGEILSAPIYTLSPKFKPN